jgi:hypothetical protein
VRRRLRISGDSIDILRNGRDVSGTRRMILEGDFDVEIEDLERYVQVRIAGATGSGSYRWTYRDPSGTLAVGDAVIVPFGYDDEDRLATVVALGRGGWDGYTKDVSSRVLTEALA